MRLVRAAFATSVGLFSVLSWGTPVPAKKLVRMARPPVPSGVRGAEVHGATRNFSLDERNALEEMQGRISPSDEATFYKRQAMDLLGLSIVGPSAPPRTESQRETPAQIIFEINRQPDDVAKLAAKYGGRSATGQPLNRGNHPVELSRGENDPAKDELVQAVRKDYVDSLKVTGSEAGARIGAATQATFSYLYLHVIGPH